MTKDEALRMAIEALNDSLTRFSTFNEMQHEAIQACKDALEQPADGIELEWYCKGWDDAEKDLATQEPVAYVVAQNDGDIRSEVISEYLKIGTKLYTTPQSREWVGLSKKEVDEIIAYPWGKTEDWVRAIEAKLKEKNT